METNNNSYVTWPVKMSLVFKRLPHYMKDQETFDNFIEKSTETNFKFFCEELGMAGSPENMTDIVQGLVILAIQLHYKKDFDLSKLLYWCSCVAFELTEYNPSDEEEEEEDYPDLTSY